MHNVLDMLNLVDIERKRDMNTSEERMGGFDLIYKDGPIEQPPNATIHSFLGMLFNFDVF